MTVKTYWYENACKTARLKLGATCVCTSLRMKEI